MPRKQLGINRRGFLKAGFAAPLAGLPKLKEIPCHEITLVEKGEFIILHLQAPRDMDAPFVEYEVWRSELSTCDVCGESFPEDKKIRNQFFHGVSRLIGPPTVQYPGEILVPIQGTCRVWVGGQEIDWLSFRTEICTGMWRGEYTHKFGLID